MYADREMGERIRTFEWADTPLGAVEDWPPALGTAVDIMLGADEAISIYWGSRHILLYNDAWRHFIGDKHPDALGQPGRDVFPELWDTIGPKFDSVLRGRGAAFEREQQLPLKRDGPLEDTWFDYSFNPIPLSDGTIGGVFNIGTEVTERVKAETAVRESEAFHRLAAAAGNMGTWSVDLDSGASVDITRRRELEEALVGASETVRQDIGRELHDVLSSDLAALAMKTDNLARTLKRDAPSPKLADTREGGLQTMRHRADLIGATLQIAAAEPGGTEVRCVLPLAAATGE